MSYTTNIKNEISTKHDNYTKIEMIAELSGFIRNNATIIKNSVVLTTENLNVAHRMSKLITTLYTKLADIITIENLKFTKKKLYQIEIKDDINYLLKDIGYFDDKLNYLSSPPSYILDDISSIKAYLKGAFYSTGSINNPKTSRYHMEMLINKPQEAVFIQKLLNEFDLNAKILNRDRRYMIYLKEADKISDFIKILDATEAVLYYENIRIYRDEKNIANRLNNCEQANTDKIIANALRELEAIKLLENTASLSLLDEKCLLVVNYRKKNPEASLKELAEIISKKTGKKLTKSGLNHRLRKIKDLAEHIKKNIERNRGEKND